MHCVNIKLDNFTPISKSKKLVLVNTKERISRKLVIISAATMKTIPKHHNTRQQQKKKGIPQLENENNGRQRLKN